MAYLLYLDTAAAAATIALSGSGELLALRIHQDAMKQAAAINGLIEEVIGEGGIRLRDVDAFCVCAGPGSYTGLRVSMSTAKGMAYALEKPLMLFNRLDLIAWAQSAGEDFAVALKARQGEYFYAQYRADKQQSVPPRHIFESGLRQQAAPGLLFFTDDETLPFSNKKILPATEPAGIASWIPEAERRFAAAQFDDLAYSEPFYLKAAYTTQPRKS